MLQDDGALVQLPGQSSVPGSEIHHNWIHDSVKYGIRYDAPVLNPELAGTDGLIHHNVLWNLPKGMMIKGDVHEIYNNTCFCLLYTSPSPRDLSTSRMPSSA